MYELTNPLYVGEGDMTIHAEHHVLTKQLLSSVCSQKDPQSHLI